jgi:hypothetical protein
MNTAKEMYQQEMQARLDRWRDEIEQLEAGAGAIETGARPAFQIRLEQLKRRYQVALHNFEEVRTSDDARWEELIPFVGVAADNVREVIEQLEQQVR